MKNLLRLLVPIILMLAILPSCSLKKNTAATRNYQAFITRYNIYFNGDEHYKQTIHAMENSYADDYTRTLFMHPAEARFDEKAPQPEGDFKRSIEKAQKAIQLRSIKKRPARKAGKGNDPEYKAWLKREEYNPFLHNAWMMMARSQYMNGDFLAAASTFFYISKHFTWLPATVTEAKLWQARSYIAVDWLFEAESILSRIKEKDLTTNRLRNLYNFCYADYYVRSHNLTAAIPFLHEAIKGAKGAQKTRLNFLLGQIYQDLDSNRLAYSQYAKVLSNSSANHRTRFNARIRQSEVFQGSDIKSEVKALRSMTRQGSNKDYLDQIYYAIGNLYLSRGDSTQAIDNYKEAVKLSTRHGIDKALAQIALGKLYYSRGEYTLAQPCYAEAIPQLPVSIPDYDILKRQSDVLDELAVYAENVVLNDSLLKLSELPPDKQLDVARRLADDLIEREKREEEERKREEYLAEQRANGTGLQMDGAASAAPSTFVMNTDNSWYFYNPGTRNAGRTEFQKRWGSRRLEDDWRRRNKASISIDDPLSDNSSQALTDIEKPDLAEPEEEKSEDERQLESDPHYPEYYLAQIPKTDEERATANSVIADGLYNMALILKDKLNDFPAAEHEFNALLTRYPDNPFRLDVFNNMFLMYLRQGNAAQTETWRQRILADFPDSKIAEAIRPADYATRLIAADSIQQNLYEQAYEAYLNNDNSRVHRITELVQHDYPMARIMPKFLFINALSYVTENNPEQFENQLRTLVERYPDTDVTPLATNYINLLQKGHKLNTAASGNVRGLLWNTRLMTTDSIDSDAASQAAQFKFSNEPSPHYLVLLYPADQIQPNQLLFDVARFNFNSFTVRDFDLEPLRFGQLGLLIVKNFNSEAEAQRYRTMLEHAAGFTLPQSVIPVTISESNFNLMLNEGRSFEEYFEAIGDHRLEQTHVQVLPPDEFPSAKEMYEQTEESEPAESVQPAANQITEQQPEPAATPTADKPAPAPTPKPEQKPAPKPAAKPAPVQPKPAPVTVPKPVPLHNVPQGSEGDDDDLLD